MYIFVNCDHRKNNDCLLTYFIITMNRLAVYRYLTRYIYWNTGSVRLFTEPLSEHARTNGQTPQDHYEQTCSLQISDSVYLLEHWICQTVPRTSVRTCPDKRTNTPGPAFEDLTLGWKQPESDNDQELSRRI